MAAVYPRVNGPRVGGEKHATVFIMTDSLENRDKTVEPFSVLMVCTGNICRSPMAEGLLRAMLSEAGPITVGSAGTHALVDSGAAPLAVAVMADLGIDILRHRGKQLKASMVQDAGLVLAMEQFHVDILREMAPEHLPKVRLLSSFSTAPIMRDIPDPYGHVKFFYRTSALILHGCIEQVAFMLGQKFPDLCTLAGRKHNR